jgi:hypothetical protein
LTFGVNQSYSAHKYYSCKVDHCCMWPHKLHNCWDRLKRLHNFDYNIVVAMGIECHNPHNCLGRKEKV